MQINFNNTETKSNVNFRLDNNILMKNSYYTSFKGNDSFEKTESNNIGAVIHETHFFREPKTDEFVQRYIRDNFKNEDNITIVSAACSTGEEAMSYSMMLDDIREKIEIIGFDIDEKSIEYTKEGIYKIKNKRQASNDWNVQPNQEGFLIDDSSEISEYQKHAKEKFYQYFTAVGGKEIETAKVPLTLKVVDDIINLFRSKEDKIHPQAVETQLFKANNGVFNNCSFRKGDILETSKMFNKESVNVFLFRNALYHLCCEGNQAYRVMKPEADNTIKNISKQVYDTLKPNGLLVFGENELQQGINKGKLYDILTMQGFVPVDIDAEETEMEQKEYENLGISKIDVYKNKIHIWKKPAI